MLMVDESNSGIGIGVVSGTPKDVDSLFWSSKL